MNKQARKEQAIKYLQQLDIYKPYIDGFEKHDHVCVFERFAGFWVYQYPEIESKMTEGELKKLKEMTAAIENQIKEYQNKILKCNNEISEANRDIDFNKELIKAKEEQIQRLLKDNEIGAQDKVKYAEEIK